MFFTNNKGEILNINGICGAGLPLVNVTYNMKSAYYYSSQSDKFLKDFMNGTFAADIYFGSAINQLMSNLSKYGFIVFEHPDISPSYFDDFKTAVENYSSRGGLSMISGQLVPANNRDLFGVDFRKKSGESESDRNSTVNNADQYLSLNVGENIVFRQAYYVENTSNAVGFKQIATFNQDGRNALSKWKFGNGTAYFFSDFDVSYFSGNFVGIVEDVAKAFIGGTCSPFNVTQGQKKLVKIERYLNYNSQVVKMVVYLWQ